ncbi:PadR family transcriptional regulator [Paenibacillus ferrarius]|uniref:PadR family transcriptional regulator n=1 Tax=Paenibacillus ferrarius TaxID=1469647 RepID=UPI003D288FA0
MNTLSYGLLSMLSYAPFSGYDLMQKIQPFWPAKHSQIYPLLAQLERDGYIQHELVVQPDKPDKKVHSLTDRGREALAQWLSQPACPPVTRDELSLKIFCMNEGDPVDIQRLLEQRVEYCREKLVWFHAKSELYAHERMDSSPGIVLLMRRALFSFQSELDWAEWALKELRGEG